MPPAETIGLARLAALVRRLRAPDGCPWDREQELADLRAYLIEEAHEAAAALDGADWDEIAAELGDLLFQVAFVGVLGEEAGEPVLPRAVDLVHEKMVARHPHVFGDEELADADAVRRAWERRKIEGEERAGVLAGVVESLPALVQAYRMTQKAAAVGFDWPDHQGVLAKLEEELDEVRQELEGGEAEEAPEPDRDALRGEIGDLLFTVANLARHLGIDPEAALAGTNRKFRERFAAVEARLAAEGRRPQDAELDELDALWEEAKGEGSCQ